MTSLFLITFNSPSKCIISRIRYGHFLKVFIFFKLITNSKNTVFNFKRFHGRSFDDIIVQSERVNVPYDLVPVNDGRVGAKVSLFTGEACTSKHCSSMIDFSLISLYFWFANVQRDAPWLYVVLTGFMDRRNICMYELHRPSLLNGFALRSIKLDAA